MALSICQIINDVEWQAIARLQWWMSPPLVSQICFGQQVLTVPPSFHASLGVEKPDGHVQR